MTLNTSYHSQEEIVEIFSELTGSQIDSTFICFPPFYTDFGKNITIGTNVFFNTGCSFQDRGGITKGNGSMIGMNVTIAITYPSPVTIGENVWIGSNATILPGVTIGDNSVVAAGAVVNRNVPEDSIVAGVPAKIVKKLIII